MAQAKGVSGNPNGRPKGTPNKMTATMREWVAGLLCDNLEQLQEDFKHIPAKDRLILAERLLHYVLPKQQAISGYLESIPPEKGPEIDLSQLSDEDVETMCQILEKYR